MTGGVDKDDLCVVGEAEDGDAIRLARSLRPDVVLMDVQMPRRDGVEATRQIVAKPGIYTRVVILTTFERDDYVFEALRVGASGFLLKNAPPEELLHAVRVVAEGNALLSPSVTRRVIEQYAANFPVSKHVEDDLFRLTDREREVLCSLAAGKSNAEVATSLYLGRAPSRPTSPTSSRSWRCATACKLSSSLRKRTDHASGLNVTAHLRCDPARNHVEGRSAGLRHVVDYDDVARARSRLSRMRSSPNWYSSP